MKRLLFCINLTLITVLFSTCSNPDKAGNSIEIENAVAFQLVYENGKPVQSASLRVRPIWFMADTLAETESSMESGVHNVLTDANGMVTFDSMPQGFFIVEANQDSLAVLHEFEIQDSMGYFRKLMLVPTGTLSGRVNIPQGSSYAWIYILGLEKTVQSDSTGRFLIQDLPAGAIRIQAVVPGIESSVGEALVQVRSDNHTEIGTVTQVAYGSEDLALWKYSQVIRIDTLISDWMQPASLPMVLTLRLDSSTLDFRQAMSQGQDIRITDLSGKSLPLSRAFWDYDRSKATLRFRVDSDSILEQGVRLIWGRASAPAIDSDSLWAGISDSLKNELYTILVDDFEDSVESSPMPPPITQSGWYFFPSDSTVTFTPTMDDGLLTGVEDAGFDRTGKAMHFQYTSIVNEGSYLLFGIGMGTGLPRDYSALDSVVFWVRGNGLFLFALDQLEGNAGKASYQDSLDSAWTKHVIRPSDFKAADNIGGNLGWDAVRDSITNLTFMIRGGSEFWIDDIRLYGLNRDDIK